MIAVTARLWNKSKHVQTCKSHSFDWVLSPSGIKAAGLMEMMETLWISWRLEL